VLERLVDRRPLVPPMPFVSFVPTMPPTSAVVGAAPAALAPAASAILPGLVVPPGTALVAVSPPRVAAAMPGGIGRVPATLGRLSMPMTMAAAVFRPLLPAVGPSVCLGSLGRFCRAHRCDLVAQLRKDSLQHIK
jgi:hypothetical protein